MEEFPADILSIIYDYVGLEMMIIMRRLSLQFNQSAIANIKRKLKQLTGFNTELLDINLLMNLCKINIIKSNVFAGEDHSFITTDERTYCTTLNQVFEFGNNIPTPQIIKDIYDIKQICVNPAGYVFLFDNDYCQCYSNLLQGQLFSIENITRVVMSTVMITMLNTSQEVYICGHNENDKLTLSPVEFKKENRLSFIEKFNPKTIETYPKIIKNFSNVKQIAVSDDCGLVLMDNNEIYGFSLDTGRKNIFTNKEPELLNHGIKDNINSIVFYLGAPVILTDNFNIYDNLIKLPVSYIVQCVFGRHALLLSLTGQVYGYGFNNCGQLGLGNYEHCDQWTIIPNLNNVIKIAAGINHSLFLTADEKIYACGANDKGQLGLGHTNNINIPTLVIDLQA